MDNCNNDKVFKVLTKKIPYSIAVKYYNKPAKCKAKLNLTEDEYGILIDKLFKYIVKIKQLKSAPQDREILTLKTIPVKKQFENSNGASQLNGTINNQLLDRRFFSMSTETLTLAEPMRMTVSSHDMIPSSQNDILRNRTFDSHIPQVPIPIIDRNCTGTRMNDFTRSK